MTAINWKTPVNGDWSVATNWSTGTVPSLVDAVTISPVGPYIVTVSSADFANSLTFNASEAALFENAGSLTMAGALTVSSGFVSLNKANTIGSVAIAGGTLAIGNGAALGTGTVTEAATNCSPPPTKLSRTRSPFRELRRSPRRMGRH